MFHRDKHVRFVQTLERQTDTFEYWATEHLKLNAVYWGVTALDLMGCVPEGAERERLLQFVVSCAAPDDSSYGGNVGHDPHLLYTLSAIQLLVLFERLDLMDVDRVAAFIVSLQQEDGSFVGDKWGEKDTRFSYCAVMGLSLLGRLHLINRDSCLRFVLACKNFDEAFGVVPEAESHAGQTFCCVATLAILGRLDAVDRDKLGWWLAERQLQCEDAEDGGISDRPENLADVFHLFFGICGLSMLKHEAFGLKLIDAEYALPKDRLLKKESA